MKKTILFFALFGMVSFLLTSCEEEDITPSSPCQGTITFNNYSTTENYFIEHPNGQTYFLLKNESESIPVESASCLTFTVTETSLSNPATITTGEICPCNNALETIDIY